MRTTLAAIAIPLLLVAGQQMAAAQFTSPGHRGAPAFAPSPQPTDATATAPTPPPLTGYHWVSTDHTQDFTPDAVAVSTSSFDATVSAGPDTVATSSETQDLVSTLNPNQPGLPAGKRTETQGRIDSVTTHHWETNHMLRTTTSFPEVPDQVNDTLVSSESLDVTLPMQLGPWTTVKTMVLTYDLEQAVAPPTISTSSTDCGTDVRYQPVQDAGVTRIEVTTYHQQISTTTCTNSSQDLHKQTVSSVPGQPDEVTDEIVNSTPSSTCGAPVAGDCQLAETVTKTFYDRDRPNGADTATGAETRTVQEGRYLVTQSRPYSVTTRHYLKQHRLDTLTVVPGSKDQDSDGLLSTDAFDITGDPVYLGDWRDVRGGSMALASAIAASATARHRPTTAVASTQYLNQQRAVSRSDNPRRLSGSGSYHFVGVYYDANNTAWKITYNSTLHRGLATTGDGPRGKKALHDATFVPDLGAPGFKDGSTVTFQDGSATVTWSTTPNASPKASANDSRTVPGNQEQPEAADARTHSQNAQGESDHSPNDQQPPPRADIEGQGGR